MTFSDATLAKSLECLNSDKALAMLGLAGSLAELQTILDRLTRTFNVAIPASAHMAIKDASKRFNAIPRNRMVSYRA